MPYQKRRGNLFNPQSARPFPMSRSKIDLYRECARCFYIDRRLGLGRPSIPGFPLNVAVDTLLKREFDLLRKAGAAHRLMKEYRLDAVPFNHPELPVWRDDHHNFVGISFYHEASRFIVSGIIDDVWVNPQGELLIVDYKATSTSKEISLEDTYKQGYKKQMEVYQWLFRQKGFKVAETGYFVFANAGKNRPEFDGRLEFELTLVPHTGDDQWVEPTLLAMRECLTSDQLPRAGAECEYCAYRKAVGLVMDQFRYG